MNDDDHDEEPPALAECDGCGDEYDPDDMYFSERRDTYLCEDCYSGDDEEAEPCERVVIASCCGTRNEYLNPLTEKFECRCVHESRKRDPLAILARFPLNVTAPERVLEVAA